MRPMLVRWMPALMAAAVLAIAGAAQAEGVTQLIQCVFNGPMENCN